ncbi:unnamed protein product [Thelazia callipaeda]|uniref:EF-hand domain-containing protein n=1 Tax=Thelazia callipaeda TaxID=103827 RepID=A0A0N5CV07_THECL|nr:unnamed protein product [Thelazia callipaeda]
MKELEQWQESNTINTDKNLKDLFNANDKNHDKVLTIAEFVPMALVLTKRPVSQSEQFFKAEQNREMAQQMMVLIDQNNDYKLTVQEVHSFANTNAQVSEEEILQTFAFLDTNRDGYLSFNELITLPDKMVELVHFKEPPPVIIE